MSSVVGLVIGAILAVWVFQVVSKKNGQVPWLWAIGTFLLPAVFVTIAGFIYNETAMKIVGIVMIVLSLGVVVLVLSAM